MQGLMEMGPWLAAMAVLIACSAFCSACEAALFSLQGPQRRLLESGNRAQRLAADLLTRPERLLSAVLFWNLVVNVAYFALASIVGLRLGQGPHGSQTQAVAFAFGSLVTIIFCGEMLPKTLGVLSAPWLAAAAALPVAALVRSVDPLMPALSLVNLLSQRLIWPGFKPEPYLELADLERAIQMSTSDAALVEQEQRVLRNIVLLSELRVDELMRPRLHFRSFRPPVALADLAGRMTPSGYLLVTEPAGDEVVGAVPLLDLCDVPRQHLEHHADPVIYVPWCATAAAALEQMEAKDRRVAVVVNEFGETIGILTFDDVLNTILGAVPGRGPLLPDRRPIQQVRPGLWHVTGTASLRRLARFFQAELPPSRSVTIAGVLQELLERVPVAGDACPWGEFDLTVLETPQRGQMLVQITRRSPGQEEPT